MEVEEKDKTEEIHSKHKVPGTPTKIFKRRLTDMIYTFKSLLPGYLVGYLR